VPPGQLDRGVDQGRRRDGLVPDGPTVTAAAVARELGGLEAFVNISRLTVSQMSLPAMTDSLRQRMHRLGERALNWSGLPVVHVRATVFLQHFFFSQWAAGSVVEDGTFRLPFGDARISPIDARDVVEVIAAVLGHPASHVGRVIELTGPRSEDMHAAAAEYSEALGRAITYVDAPMAEWRGRELLARGLPEHVAGHMKVMAQLHAENRYDRLTRDFEAIVGRRAKSIREYVARHPEMFGPSRPARALP
jgi:NAD(P)H dehydrogenase (quinone)